MNVKKSFIFYLILLSQTLISSQESKLQVTMADLHQLYESKNYGVLMANIYQMQSQIQTTYIFELFDLEQKTIRALGGFVPWVGHYWLRFMLLVVPVGFLKLLMILLLLLLILLLCKVEKIQSWFGYRSLIVFLIFISIFWVAQSKIIFSKKAFVVKPNTLFYAGPETTFNAIATLPVGSSAFVLGSEKSMYKIKNFDNVGFVESDNIMVI